MSWVNLNMKDKVQSIKCHKCGSKTFYIDKIVKPHPLLKYNMVFHRAICIKCGTSFYTNSNTL